MKELLTLIQPAFEWTWKNSVQVALLIGLVLLVQKVLGRWLTPRLRYALSLLILFRLLLPAAPQSTMSLQNLFAPAVRLPTRQAVSSLVAEPVGPNTSMVAGPVPMASPPALPAAAPSAIAAPRRLTVLSAAEVLGLAWACGLLTLVSLAGWRYIQWCRLIGQGRRLSDPRLLALLDGAREAMGVRRPVTLVALARLSSPAVFGFWRVRLLLPEDALDQLTDQDLRLLFLHEMAHVRRQDMLLNLLLMAVQFVHWFNPLVWVGLHRLRADRELVCDAMVLQRTKPEERSDYGGLLLKLLGEFPAAQRMIHTAVPLLSSTAELRRRMVLIRHHRRSSLAVRLATTLVAMGLACSTFTGSSEQQRAHPAQDVAGVSRISPNHFGQGQTNQPDPVDIGRAIDDAAKSGDLGKAKALLKQNPALISSRNTNGWTPLHRAVLADHKDVAILLLDKQAEVNAKDNEGMTPLHYAAFNGNRALVELLLANKAEVNANARDGTRPLHFAAFFGHKAVAALLLRKHAEVNSKNGNGWTPLECAAFKGNEDLVELLLASQSDVNGKGNDGRTALHLAIKQGHSAVATLLLNNKADVNAKDEYDRTPLIEAARHDNKAVAALLLAGHADVNAKDGAGMTALHETAERGFESVAELLLANKADIDARDNNGWTPLKRAVERGQKDMVTLLRQHGSNE